MKSLKGRFGNVCLLSVFFTFSTLTSVTAIGVSAGTVLTSGGDALMPIVISEDASERTGELAEELAGYLEKISGAAFDIERGEGSTGIVMGTAEELPGLDMGAEFDPGAPFRREEYVIRSSEDGLLLVGATEIAVSHALWHFLYKLGHRQFLPTDTWEVIPSLSTIEVESGLNLHESPDYYNRRIWHGSTFGYGNLLDRWSERNRAASGFRLSTGHTYRAITRRNQEAFDENPEFYAKVDGERKHIGGNTKFCIANEDLRALVVEDAVRRVEEDPGLDSVSMDPSDGGNWCECDGCERIGDGRISDRVVLLANEVAEAINELGHGPKYVGIYAYGRHSPPPSIEVHPKVVVSVATRYLREGYSAGELVEKWSERGAELLGLREYYYGTRNLPNTARGASIHYLRRTLPRFHGEGVRFNSANIDGGWGGAGFGYYVLARVMWDISELERAEELFDDFLDKAFAEAREPMRGFYRLLHRFDEDESRPMLSEDLVGRMYRKLSEAYELAQQDEVRDRLDDLAMYTRFVELAHRMLNASGSARQEAYERWVEHAYSITDRRMIHAGRVHTRIYAPSGVTPVRDLDGFDSRKMRDEADEPEDVRAMVEAGVADNELLDFEPVEFSEDLVPAAQALGLSAGAHGRGSFGHSDVHRSSRDFFIWMDEPGEITLRIQAGRTWQNRGPVNLTLYSVDEPRDLGPVDSDDSVPPDREWHEVTLKTSYSGLHELQFRDGDGRSLVEFPEGMPVTLNAGFRPQVGFSLFFYVPKGTDILGGYVDSRYRGIYDNDGNRVVDFEEMGGRGYFSAEVPEGQDGKLWFVRTWRGRGEMRLMTVPPQMARSPEELLLPKEVVEADSEE